MYSNSPLIELIITNKTDNLDLNIIKIIFRH